MCDRCPELEERVAWLESELGIQRSVQVVRRLREFMLSQTGKSKVGRSQVAELVAALYAANGRPLTRYQIMEAIPSPTGRDDRDDKLVDVWVCFARRSFGRETISNVWGRGYALSGVGVAKVAGILGDATKAAA
jgi:DNA-binding winged helix-turn-helix (wHTH) protein